MDALPLSTATLSSPGQVRSPQQLVSTVKGGKYVPVWVHAKLAHEILAKHGKDGGAILHPGIRLKNPQPPVPQQPIGALPWMEGPDIYKALNTDVPGVIERDKEEPTIRV